MFVDRPPSISLSCFERTKQGENWGVPAHFAGGSAKRIFRFDCNLFKQQPLTIQEQIFSKEPCLNQLIINCFSFKVI